MRHFYNQLHAKPYHLAALAVILVATIAVGGSAMAGTTLKPIAHNYYLDAEYNLDTKVLTVTSKYGNFASLESSPVDIYDRNDLTHPRWISLDGFTISGNKITKTLDTNAHNKLNTAEPGIFFRDRWATYYDSNNIPRYVPAGDNPVTKVYNPPTVTNGTYDSSTRTITLTTDKAITKVYGPSICIVYAVNTPFGDTWWSSCAKTATISSDGTTITVTVKDDLPSNLKVTGTSLEVWQYALKSIHGQWSTQTYHKSLN